MINYTVLYTLKISKVDLILSALITHAQIRRIYERRKDTFEGDEYVYGIDCNDNFMHAYLSPNSISCACQIHTTMSIKHISR